MPEFLFAIDRGKAVHCRAGAIESRANEKPGRLMQTLLANAGAGDLAQPKLARRLTYRDLLLYGLAYIAPVAPLSTFGFVWQASGGLVALAYLLGALCMFFTARNYAVMTEVVTSAGSVYSIARVALGPLPGFIAGWLILLDYLLIPAFIFVLMAIGMNKLVPQVDRTVWILVFVLTTTTVNWFGINVTARVNMLAVMAQFVVVLSIVGFAVYQICKSDGFGALTLNPFYSSQAFSIHGIFAGTSICVLSFLGFDAIATLSEEVQDNDRRMVGRAIINVLLICGALFVLTVWALAGLMPGFTPRDPATAFFDLASVRFGPSFSILLAWLLILIVGFTNAVPMQAGVARVLFAMGRDGQLPQLFGRLHPRRGEPHVAMLFSAIFSLAVAEVMHDRLDVLASLVSFGALAAFLFLHVSVLVHMAWRSASRQYFAHWAVPILGIAVVVAVLCGMAPAALTAGCAWLAIGVAYALILHRRTHLKSAQHDCDCT